MTQNLLGLEEAQACQFVFGASGIAQEIVHVLEMSRPPPFKIVHVSLSLFNLQKELNFRYDYKSNDVQNVAGRSVFHL